jgi:glycine cleavage system H protein
MNTPESLLYTKEHEWVRIEGERVVIGITDFAQSELGDVVYVELPDLGAELAQAGELGTIESVKTASDLYAPLSGTVAAKNALLENQPELVNNDPYGAGWMLEITASSLGAERGQLLSAADYEKLVA